MTASLVHLFTDLEGSTRLWEAEPERMRAALAAHDALARRIVGEHRGRLVKTTGDGVHAVFEQAPSEALDAVAAAVAMQRALADAEATAGLPLSLRCGLHAGADEARDNDFYGRDVNRAARIMSVAHGGQVLVSGHLAETLRAQMPPGCALKPLGRVRLRDLAEPESLHQVLAEGLRSAFPPPRGLAETPHNLPQPLNRFVGREALIDELQSALQAHRLVTLWGPGGIGKSRLSLELGRRLLQGGAFDGVWFIELAPLADGQRLPQAVAAVLGVKESAGQDLSQALLNHVRDRRLLLILDNCEHVHEAAATLAKALLQAGAQLHILASSRELLRVAGEQAFPVPALSVPADPQGGAPMAGPASGSADDLARLLAHESVRLFAERASAARPGFSIEPAQAAWVAQICRRLDGIPLALELAAARVRSMPVETLAARLADSFRLVATQDRTVPERQRTLQVLIDWSHDLLDPVERRLLARLSVFAGGFTLEAAEAVCADPLPAPDAEVQAAVQAGPCALLDEPEVADRLGQLVDKSLVELDPGGERYRLLETVRLYAAAKRQPADEAALLRRYLLWYADFAERAAPELDRPDSARWLQRCDAERPNLLQAHAHALAAARTGPEAEPALRLAFRLAVSLRPYCLHRGLLSTGLQLLRSTVALPALVGAGAAVPAASAPAAAHPPALHPSAAHAPALQPPAPAWSAERARLLFELGHLCNFMGRAAEARTALEESLALMRRLGHAVREASILQPLGQAYAALGETDRARECFEQAIAVARQLGLPLQLMSSLVQLAQWHQNAGQALQAEPLYRQALGLARAHGTPTAVATILLNLGMVALSRGAVDDSIAQAAEAAGLLGDHVPARLLLALQDLGCALAVQRHNPQLAADLMAASDALCARTGLHRDPGDVAFIAPWRQRLAEQETAGATIPPTPAEPAGEGVLPRLMAWLAAGSAAAAAG